MGWLGAALTQAWHRRSGRVGASILLLLGAAAVLLPPFLPSPIVQPDVLHPLLAPGAGHWLGTDALSRDVLARLVSGARISLAVAGLSVLLSVTLGVLVGLAAGVAGGLVDTLLMRTVDAALCIPRLFILLLLLGRGVPLSLPLFIGVLGATGWYGTSRLVRAEVLRLRESDFVSAARGLGAGRGRVIFRHLLPSAIGPVLVAATLGVGDVVLLEASLSYLGLGIQPPTPTLGGMIYEAREALVQAPWASLFPGGAIVLAVLAANLFGDALRDAVEPRDA